ncbi:juvenile hormone esterase-like [Culex pipiens pallens]|uniref:juvenile hormone esterase-like n=1 Tax=Culex pipiens pallens TaxID=42434 RepID=UPI001952F4B0|nr:juvenile hormone esterase-like [Culex pipiens pallens]
MWVVLVVAGLLGSVAGEHPCTVRFGEGRDGEVMGVGVLNTTFNGLVYCEYLGIRYAEPPVGELRYKSPVVREPSGSEDYSKLGSICAQLNSIAQPTQVVGDEDCLFMNVYSPAVRGSSSASRKYPVMVYIHGGSYAIWSPQTDMFGVDLLIESEVLIVSFNYRLFVLGFLRHPEFNVTGNYGLKDQLAALQWVQRYIEAFGGDANNVTIMGQSVGAHSVTYHLYLEPFRGLFHRVIAMSGSLLAPSAMIYQPEDYNHQYLESLHIHTQDQLMHVPFKDLFQFDNKKRRFIFSSIALPIFLPTVESASDPDALLTQPAHELILNEPVNQVPLMIGMTSSEFLPYFTTARSFSIEGNFPNRGNSSYLDVIKRLIWKANILVYKVDPEGTGQHFFGKLSDLSNMYFPVKRLLKQTSENGSYGAPIYYYQFEFDGQFGKYKNSYYREFIDFSIAGAMHGDDLGYLFSPYVVKEALANRTKFETEWKVTERNVEQITNFIKFGNPTPNFTDNIEVLWPPYNSGDNASAFQYLNINERNEVRVDNDRSNFAFQVWNTIHNCLFYFDCTPVDILLKKIIQQLESRVTKLDLDSLFDYNQDNLA